MISSRILLLAAAICSASALLLLPPRLPELLREESEQSSHNEEQSHELHRRALYGTDPLHMYTYEVYISVELDKTTAETQFGGPVPDDYASWTHPVCAGVVLTQSWILTSASCVDNIVKNNWLDSMRIYANRRNTSTSVMGEAFVEFKLENGQDSVRVHQFFNPSDPALRNNIALLNVKAYTHRGIRIHKLRGARYLFPKYEKREKPIYSNLYDPYGVLTTGGWGVTDNADDLTGLDTNGDRWFLGRTGVMFKSIQTVVALPSDCKLVAPSFVDDGMTICTWYLNANYNPDDPNSVMLDPQNLCEFDTGAPLFRLGRWINHRLSYDAKLIGIFSNWYSLSGKCNDPDTPVAMVFTYLAPYCNWIRTVTDDLSINCMED